MSLPRLPRASIVTIGNELLVGRIVNTNAFWLASRLTVLGVNVTRILTVGDDLDEIVWAVRTSVPRSDIVVTTGGLGPTDDDITMEAIAVAVHKPLVLNMEAYRMVSTFYQRYGQRMSRERLKMALLPAGAKPIPNPVGAAPGAHITVGRTEVFVLPGVPREMEAMFENYVVKAISYMLPGLCVVEKGVRVEGVPEADLAPILRRATRLCGERCYIKSHPKGHEGEKPIVEVKVLVSRENCDEAEAAARKVIQFIERQVGDRSGH